MRVKLFSLFAFLFVFWILAASVPQPAFAAINWRPISEGDGDGITEDNEQVTVEATGCAPGNLVEFVWDYSGSWTSPNRSAKDTVDADGKATYTNTYQSGTSQVNGRTVKISSTVYMVAYCYDGTTLLEESPQNTIIIAVNDSSSAEPTVRPTFPPPPKPICERFDNGKCVEVNTAIGIICTEADCFVESLFGFILSLSGGIAVLTIMYAGYVFLTSRGNPEAINKGREMIIAAIVGLLFIVFSFVIMETLTGDILRLPGFNQFGP